MNASTVHPLTRGGEPRALYLSDVLVRIIATVAGLAAWIAVIAAPGDLWVALGALGVVLFLCGFFLERGAWRHFSASELRLAREPVWLTVLVEVGMVAALATLPTGMLVLDAPLGLIVSTLTLSGAAGAVVAIAINRRKTGTRRGRIVRASRAVTFTALATAAAGTTIRMGGRRSCGGRCRRDADAPAHPVPAHTGGDSRAHSAGGLALRGVTADAHTHARCSTPSTGKRIATASGVHRHACASRQMSASRNRTSKTRGTSQAGK